jgi:hypothetical protein
MKNLRFPILFVLMLMISLSSCFEQGDEVLPVSPVEAKRSDLVGAWQLYYIDSPTAPADHKPLADAAIWLNDDLTTTARRKGKMYHGTWSLSKDGGYVSVEFRDASIEFPGIWSIQYLTPDEMWVKTGLKEMRFRRFSENATLEPVEIIEN